MSATGSRRPVPRFGHGSRVPGWDDAVDLTKPPATVPDPALTPVPPGLKEQIEASMAKYPDRRSAAIPALHAAQEASVAPLQAIRAGELSADMATDIEARPVVDNFGNRINRRLRVGALRKIGAERRRSQRDTSSCAEQ